MQYELNFTSLLLRFQLEGSYLLLWCYVGFFGNFSRSRVALAEWWMAILLWTVPTTLSLSSLHRQLVLIIIIINMTLSAILLIKTCQDWNHHHNHLHCQHHVCGWLSCLDQCLAHHTAEARPQIRSNEKWPPPHLRPAALRPLFTLVCPAVPSPQIHFELYVYLPLKDAT